MLVQIYHITSNLSPHYLAQLECSIIQLYNIIFKRCRSYFIKLTFRSFILFTV